MPTWLGPVLGVVALVVCIGATHAWYKRWKKQKEAQDADNSNKKV